MKWSTIMSERLSHQQLADVYSPAPGSDASTHWSSKEAVHAWSQDHTGAFERLTDSAHKYFGSPLIFGGESESQAVQKASKLSGMPLADIMKMSLNDIKQTSALDLAGVPMQKRSELLEYSGLTSGLQGALRKVVGAKNLHDLYHHPANEELRRDNR
jgi:hypothetical protein